MNKNTNPMNDIINDFTEKFGDNKVQMTFRDVKEGMDSYFGLISMTTELIKLCLLYTSPSPRDRG